MCAAVLPRVLYDRSMLQPDIHYRVSLNAELIARILRENDLPDEEIGRVTVIIRADPRDARLGTYDHADRAITVNVGPAFRGYEVCLRRVQAIVSGDHTPGEEPFSLLLKTKRLQRYLWLAPSERGFSYANKLLLKAVQRAITATVLHEGRHAAVDGRPGRAKGTAGRQLMVGVLCASVALAGLNLLDGQGTLGRYAAYLFFAGVMGAPIVWRYLQFYSAEEVEAREYAAKRLDDPRLSDLVEIRARRQAS